jgi:RHS repeat-associated protein
MFAATSGYRNDGDAGLSHVGARYYDAQVGRFITRDMVLTGGIFSGSYGFSAFLFAGRSAAAWPESPEIVSAREK